MSGSTLNDWIENHQAMGRYTFTRTDVEGETGRSFIAVQSALRRLKKQKKIVSPLRGFYVVVPPEYRSVGSPPASWFIDSLMRHKGQPYYVGLLSAAALHGAAHQQPMLFQVVTDKPIRSMYAGKVTISFVVRGQMGDVPVIEKQTETGTMLVSTPEATAFDLVRYQSAAGQLGHVATVLEELAEGIDKAQLADLAPRYRCPDVQRLGYMLDKMDESALADSLFARLSIPKPRKVPLRLGGADDRPADNRWHIIPNVDLEDDL